jgi:hypothetical protein
MCVDPISVLCVRVGIGPEHVPPAPLSLTGMPRRAIDVGYTASRGHANLLTPALRWVSGRRPIYAALQASTDRQRNPDLVGAATTCPLLLQTRTLKRMAPEGAAEPRKCTSLPHRTGCIRLEGARTETLEEKKQVAAVVGRGSVRVEGYRSAQEHQLDWRITPSSASNARATR